MSYEIKQVDISDKNVEYELRLLIRDAFAMAEPIPEGHLYSNTVSKTSSQPSLFLAAIEDGKIIGCNGFISTDFKMDGRTVACYQSCWTATHPQHQGRKIFVNLINDAKKLLAEKGAGFIYGVPNNNSRPIFINKLGFKEIPCLMVQIPNIPVIRNFWLNRPSKEPYFYNTNTFRPVEKQIAELKKNQDESIVEITCNHSYAWGKILDKRKYGIGFKYFYVGGLEINDGKDINLLMNEIFQLPVHYIQIASCSANRYNEFFGHWKESGINPFIFFELNSIEIRNINMMYGAIDVF